MSFADSSVDIIAKTKLKLKESKEQLKLQKEKYQEIQAFADSSIQVVSEAKNKLKQTKI